MTSDESSRDAPQLPGLTLLRRIGGGTYGEVWLARESVGEEGAFRAVKLVRRDRFEDAHPYEREWRGQQRFESLSRSHVGIVDVLRLERDDARGLFFSVMELADDADVDATEVNPKTYEPRTLQGQLAAHGALPPAECLKVGVSLARALAHLHTHELVHRDVKPSNIIYVGGKPKLVDIGLVARFDSTPSAVGTFGYIPYEGPGKTTADVFALGKVLYEMATGKDRYDFPELPAPNPELRGLNAVILKACADLPKERYPNAVEMAEDFNKLMLDATSFTACTASSGQIDVSITGGNAPFTTEWSNGATGLNLTDLAGGDYTLTVTDALGCSVDTTITIDDILPTVFVGDVQHVSCNGAANGAIDITIIEGTPNFIFEWDNGMMTEDISGLTAGTYRLKITDGNGCSVWGSYNVLEPQALTATLDVIQPTSTNDGEIDLTVDGGTAPYSYTWNTGDVSEDLFGVPAGFYEVTVIDDNGCEIIVSETLQNTNTASVTDLEQTNINVFPNPTSDYATVSWDNGEINTITIVGANGQVVERADVSLQNTFKTQNLNSGMYFITLTDENNNTNTEKLIVR